MLKVITPLALASLLAVQAFAPARAGDAPPPGLTLVLGNLEEWRGMWNAGVAIHNDTDAAFSFVTVECGYYDGERYVNDGVVIVQNVMGHSVAHTSTTHVTAPRITAAECRISGVTR